MRSEHPLGWVHDKETREEDRGLILSASPPERLLLPSEGGLDRETWILLQHGGSCTGHLCAELIYAKTGEKTSPYFPWVYGRLRDGATPKTLRDVGVTTAGFIRAYREHGSCEWERWRPGAPGFGLHEIPPPLARVSAQKRNLTVRRILPVFDAPISLQIVSNLTQQIPCGLHVAVDEAFDAAGSEVVGTVAGPILGHHVITPWKFRKSAFGEYEIGCVNSWGTGYGDHGLVWLAASRVDQTDWSGALEDVS